MKEFSAHDIRNFLSAAILFIVYKNSVHVARTTMHMQTTDVALLDEVIEVSVKTSVAETSCLLILCYVRCLKVSLTFNNAYADSIRHCM